MIYTVLYNLVLTLTTSGHTTVANVFSTLPDTGMSDDTLWILTWWQRRAGNLPIGRVNETAFRSKLSQPCFSSPFLVGSEPFFVRRKRNARLTKDGSVMKKPEAASR